ncbi:MAG: hypothetical protein Aurels2KO_51900 [Aureliella sp.]
MNSPQITNKQLIKLLQTYWQWRWLWMATTVLFAGAGFAYVMTLKQETWVAAQGLIVRDEAHGAVMRLGRFQSQTDMKAAQETILEMARNPQVVRNALAKVGREEPGPLDFDPPTGPPTTAEIEALAYDGIEVRAPRGAELGTTEVIYLDITASTPERAKALNSAVCDELEHHMQEVRKVRADGVIAELATAAQSARESLDESTVALRKIEEAAGADLSDLRSLADSVTGTSANRTLLDSITSELRKVDVDQRQAEEQLKLAESAFEDPDKLLTAPAKVLNDNPGLLKLRDGLSAATIKTSELRGRFTPEHPRVTAAVETEEKIREQMRVELGSAVAILRRGLELNAERAKKLEAKRAELNDRLERLATIRADYSNIIADVRARSEQVQAADRELAGAKASRDAALTSSLITRLDHPLVGDSPEGPGKASVLIAASVSGLLFGVGLVFLLSPIEMGGGGFGRRASDGAGFGRRTSDQMRLADQGVSGAHNRRGSDRASDIGQRASDGRGAVAGAEGQVERRRRSRDADAAPSQPDTTEAVVARADSTVTNITSQVDVAQQTPRRSADKSELSFAEHANATPRAVKPRKSKSAGSADGTSRKMSDSAVMLQDPPAKAKKKSIPNLDLPQNQPPTSFPHQA